MTSRHWACWAATLLAFPIPQAVAQAPSETIAARTRDLLPILNGEGTPTAVFASHFLEAVPEAQLRKIAADVTARIGRATGYQTITMREPQRAEVMIAFERGRAHGGVVVEPAGAGRITGFWIDSVEPEDIAALSTLDAVAAEFTELPGTAGLAIMGVEAEHPMVAQQAERPFAIGSAFKLVILAELVRAVDGGERKWDDPITLGATELPAGAFRGLAPATRVPLRQLAEAMIRVSDNSATDVLLRELGRERVEAMQTAIGLRHAQANVPFLSTMEAFKLKGVDAGALGRRYLASDTTTRRRLLQTEVARHTGAELSALFADGRPVMIEQLEWFASPADLVRVMSWFVTHADRPAGGEALRILSLNPGPGASLRERLGYIGYKGGSEPGVLNMTVLVRNPAGAWKVVTASWNNPEAGLDETRFAALVTRALTILATK
jgi:beta-lactamase class A